MQARKTNQNNQNNQNHQSQRFRQSVDENTSASEDTARIEKENAKLVEEIKFLREKNQIISDENKNLKDNLVVKERKLKQAEKELQDATDLLVDMQLELNNWKTDVLGFRDEIRQAEKAQLNALLKILTVLGGEVKAGQSGDEVADAAGQSETINEQ
jgi:chromosome segregation ATPase